MAFFFINTKKDIIMAEEDEEEYRNIIICGFCEKKMTFYGRTRENVQNRLRLEFIRKL